MLPRPSTTISLQPRVQTLLMSVCTTNEPSGSRRRSVSPVTRRRPSGSHSVAQPSPGRPGAATSQFPSRSTARTSSAPQCENHNRPSCQRGDSTYARPSTRTRTSDAGVCAAMATSRRANNGTLRSAPTHGRRDPAEVEFLDAQPEVIGVEVTSRGPGLSDARVRQSDAGGSDADLGVVGPVDLVDGHAQRPGDAGFVLVEVSAERTRSLPACDRRLAGDDDDVPAVGVGVEVKCHGGPLLDVANLSCARSTEDHEVVTIGHEPDRIRCGDAAVGDGREPGDLVLEDATLCLIRHVHERISLLAYRRIGCRSDRRTSRAVEITREQDLVAHHLRPPFDQLIVTTALPRARPSPTWASASGTSSSPNVRSTWMLTSPAMHRSASGSKWAGPSFTASSPKRRRVSRPAIQPIVTTHSNAGTDPPTQR